MVFAKSKKKNIKIKVRSTTSQKITTYWTKIFIILSNKGEKNVILYKVYKNNEQAIEKIEIKNNRKIKKYFLFPNEETVSHNR